VSVCFQISVWVRVFGLACFCRVSRLWCVFGMNRTQPDVWLIRCGVWLIGCGVWLIGCGVCF